MISATSVEPLVMLPGMMCDWRLFSPQIASLSGGREVLAPTLDQADDMTSIADALLSVLPERFALAGLSMGGLVAMEIVRVAPTRVSRLALLDSNPLAEPLARQTERLAQMARVRDGALIEVMRDEMKPNYLADGPTRQSTLDLVFEMAMDLGPEVFLRQSRAIKTRRDQLDTLRRVSVPTLILCGREDSLCPPERHRLMHRTIPQSTLAIIDGAGHLPTLERPEETTSHLRAWLDE